MTEQANSISEGNPNVEWAKILVDELGLCGLRAVCIAPGSRSTPLTLAFAAHPSIQIYRHLDERSAAFFALGLAMAVDEPTALVCTSGTAAANFYPAIIEAKQSHVPLLVLTADRPPELRDSGANQTIDQIKMYGDQVIWSVDLALPQRAAPEVAIRNLRTMAARAMFKANGLSKGPVHLNLPFRKPLEPSRYEREERPLIRHGEQDLDMDVRSPFTRFSSGVLTPLESQIEVLHRILTQSERGLIVCGPRCQSKNFPDAVSALSRWCGYPLLADPLSGVRFGPHGKGVNLIGGYDTFLPIAAALWEEPEVVIRFGEVPTSNALNSYLDSIGANHRIHISESGTWSDDSHRINSFFHGDPTLFCRMLARRPAPRSTSKWAERIRNVESACWRAMDEALGETDFDGAFVADLVGQLPPETMLFAGNSLPVRHLDQFGRPGLKPLYTYGNRGASGIDGNVSSALGVSVSRYAPLVALVGDITLYHDLNGLLAVKSFGLEPTIVLLNNNGGGIFHRLPVKAFDPPFTELFVTPHGLEFEPAVRMYGLDFVRAHDRASFRRILSGSMEDRMPRVIEVKTESSQDEARRRSLISLINRKIFDELGEASGARATDQGELL